MKWLLKQGLYVAAGCLAGSSFSLVCFYLLLWPVPSRFEADNRPKHDLLSNAKVGIVSMSIPIDERILVSEWNHALYAAKHGYKYWSRHEMPPECKQERVHFHKVELIAQVLSERQSEIDLLLWIDSDAIFINCQTSLRDVWQSAVRSYQSTLNEHDINVILSGGFKAGLNSGVLLLRNCEWTRRVFMSRWLQFSRFFSEIRVV